MNYQSNCDIHTSIGKNQISLPVGTVVDVVKLNRWGSKVLIDFGLLGESWKYIGFLNHFNTIGE